MGELKVKIQDETEETFRRVAMHEFGFQKGSISLAANQALAQWARRHEDLNRLRKIAKEKRKDPVEAMTGMIKGIKIDSVKLKHEISKERAERWKKHVSH